MKGGRANDTETAYIPKSQEQISAQGMQTAAVCPKCSYVRQPADKAPAWQCPGCGIAYAKYAAYLQQAKVGATQLVVPPKAGEAAPPIQFDGSIWLLLAVNVGALGVAHWQQWPLTQLMLTYWVQSIAIGMSYVLRILALEKFSTEGMKILGEPVEARPEMRSLLAMVFVFAFGFVHVMYLVLLYAGAKTPLRFDLWFWLCAAAFALNHYWSYRYNRELDRQGTPNAGTLMMTPFVRVVPMHLMMVSGAAFVGNLVLPFGVLKIGADLGMHLVEHAQLQKIRKGEA
jgi:ribosomal protein L37AE/L43A